MSCFYALAGFWFRCSGKLRQTYRSLKPSLLPQIRLAKVPVSRLQPDVYFTTSSKVRWR